jgi:hypothetical protein
VLFVESAYKRPIWILASIGFCSSLGYIYTFESTQPERIAAIERTIEEARLYEEDFAVLTEHSQRMAKAFSDYSEIASSRVEILNNIIAREPVLETALDTHNRVIDLKKRVSSFHNELRGITFRSPNSESFLKQMKRDDVDIVLLLNNLTNEEKELIALLSGDTKTYLKNVQASNADMESALPERETRRAESNSFSKDMDALGRARDIAHEELRAKLRVLRLKLLLEDMSAGFVLFYLLASVRGVIKNWPIAFARFRRK